MACFKISVMNVRAVLVWGVILVGGNSALAQMKVPTITDNQGMSKYDRINKIEQDTIKMAEEFNQQQNTLEQRLQSLQEQDTKLMEEVQKLQTSLAALEQKMEQRWQELKRALPPPPPPTPTRVPTANI